MNNSVGLGVVPLRSSSDETKELGALLYAFKRIRKATIQGGFSLFWAIDSLPHRANACAYFSAAAEERGPGIFFTSAVTEGPNPHL